MKRSLVASFIPLLCVASLVGCNKDNGIQVTNIKTGIQYLSVSKNYTFSYVGTTNQHDFVFTSDYMGVVSSEYASATDVYIQEARGVYRLRYSNKYLPGEIQVGKSLWDDGYRNTLLGVDTTFVNELQDSDSVKISDKGFKLAYAYLIGYTLEQFVNIDYLQIDKRVDNGKIVLRFTISYLGNLISYDAHDFGTSKSKTVDDFLTNGGKPFNPSRQLYTTRELMKANNYVQAVYYFGATAEESGYAAVSYYHPHYYMSAMNGSTSGTGVISINSTSRSMKGCYYFSLDLSNGAIQYATQPMTDNTDVVWYYHYPSLLSLWDNMEMLENWTNQDMGEYTPTGAGYYTSDKKLIDDFSSNFSMSENFSGQRPVSLAIDFTVTTANEPVIYFYYKFSYEGGLYVMPFPFYNFGKANLSPLDSFYTQYND